MFLPWGILNHGHPAFWKIPFVCLLGGPGHVRSVFISSKSTPSYLAIKWITGHFVLILHPHIWKTMLYKGKEGKSVIKIKLLIRCFALFFFAGNPLIQMCIGTYRAFQIRWENSKYSKGHLWRVATILGSAVLMHAGIFTFNF